MIETWLVQSPQALKSYTQNRPRVQEFDDIIAPHARILCRNSCRSIELVRYWYPPPEPVVYRSDQPAAAIVALAENADAALTSPASTSTVVNQFITQPVIEREVLASDAITRAELDAALAALRTDLLAAIQRSLPSVYTITSPAPAAPVSFTAFAHSQKIDQLANVTISNATVSGVTGLTDADVPDTITLSNYMPLTGGTFSGGLTLPYLTATSTADTSSFAGNVSIGTTTSSSNSFLLHLANNSSSGSQIGIDNADTTGRVEINYTEAGATTAFSQWRGSSNSSLPSTLRIGTNVSAGQLILSTGVGGNRLTITSAGLVGIGTTTPNSLLEVSGSNSGTNLTTFTSAITSAITNRSTTNNTYAALAFRTQDTSGAATSSAQISGVAASHTAGMSSGDLAFLTNNAGSFTEKMRVLANGNVGLGTSTPWAKLAISASNGETNTRLFDISSSTASATTSLFTVLNSGNVGIGTTSPQATLHIVNNSGPAARLERSHSSTSATNPNAALQLHNPDQTVNNFSTLSFTTNDTGGTLRSGGFIKGIFTARGATDITSALSFVVPNAGTYTEAMRISPSGSIGIATTTPWRTLSVTGTVGFDGLTGATGAGSLCLSANREVVYNSASDACLPSLRETKHDISSLSLDGLSIIDALEPVSFVYNEGDGRTRYGFIAEDTAAVDPRLVTYSASGTLSGIDDRSILSIVVKAIQQLAGRVDAYFSRTETLEAEVAALKAEVAAIKSQVGAAGGVNASPSPSSDSEDIAPDTDSPIITIIGNNPAVLQVGDTYNDLGATVSDNVDNNIGMSVFLGSTPMEWAYLDTREPNEWRIHYVASDSAGNTATSTRTVIVETRSDDEIHGGLTSADE